jgi:hypothetical protein
VDDNRRLLRHFLAALAYRTLKAVRGAPDSFGSFQAGAGVRTPAELARHMTSVLSYARTCFAGGTHVPPDALPSLADEIARLREVLEDLSQHLGSGATTVNGVTLDQLLQGPFSDAMTHAGQLAMLRRLAGSPIPPEDFVAARISAEPFADR